MTTLAYETEASRRALEKERRALMTQRILNIFVYIILTAVAYLLLFPFLYLLFTSLKTTTDVFHFPPRLLPYVPLTTEYNGEQVTLYSMEVNGQQRNMVDTGESVRFGFFTTEDLINVAEPRQSGLITQVPIDLATDTGRVVNVGGTDFPVYSVEVNGQSQELLLAFRGGLSRFVAPDDPTVEAFANARTTSPVERVEFQWANYQSVLQLRNLDRSLINTALVTVLVTAGQVLTSLLGGYAFSRMQFRGRDAVFLVYLGTIMIPFVVLIIPLYQLMQVLGWQDHLVALVLPWIFTAYGTFLMRQFFITIPKELEEAAQLDGLSRFGTLFRVFVPLSGAAIATQAIITFLYAWNSFIWPLVIISEGNTPNHVVTLTLNQLRNAAQSEPNLMLTGAAVAILPPLILFVLAQRYFVEGIANTGSK
ncbi:MAG TPA: carbohydrate ABC transporter permease [Aggregatilineales bacterium]|nr:carbohydrate ABC transporter permease [Aggregatilineales bacterium]